jgi:hypothetical protein
VHIDPGRFHRLYIITSDWHMPRSQAMFEKVFSLCPTSTLFSICNLTQILPSWLRKLLLLESYDLSYIPVASGISDQAVLKARIGRERKSLQAFLNGPSKEWKSFEELHRFIFTSHTAYATNRFMIPSKEISPEELKTY